MTAPNRTETGLTAPLLNLNGAAGKSLVEAYSTAAHAVQAAMKLLQQTTPHGRDFQTAPAGEYQKALSEHTNRYLALERVYNELYALARNVDAQVRR